MPTYEYMCEDCGYEFELFQAITARPVRKCPKCGKPSLKRLIGTGSGIIFKGSGFYQTDYRSESYKRSEKSEKGTPDTDKKKKQPKATDTKDTKPDKKAKPTTKDEKKSA